MVHGKPHLQTAPYALPLPGNTATLWSVLGTDVVTGRDIVISQKARQQGLYVIGTNGTGKTTLINNLIQQNIRQGEGVCLIEPHGDLTAQILAGIPATDFKTLSTLMLRTGNIPLA